MKHLLLVLCVAIAGRHGLAQELPRQAPKPIKFQIYHADPWFVVAMMQGQLVASPELSTIFGMMGVPPQVGQAMNGLLKGKWMVNPTDNSIWFIPDPGT